MRKFPLNFFAPVFWVTHLDQQNERFFYNLVTKAGFFHKPIYNTLKPNLQALKQDLERHNIQQLVFPKLDCGYGQLHCPTVFSILFIFFLFDPY